MCIVAVSMLHDCEDMCMYLRGCHAHRYGCKLSQKLFVGKEYVLKHIKLKHTAVMEAQRDEVSLHHLVSLHCSLSAKTLQERLEHQHCSCIASNIRLFEGGAA